MKSLLIRLMPAALLCLALTACGGGGAVGQTPYDPETAAQALLDSGAFSDDLDTVDQDTAAPNGWYPWRTPCWRPRRPPGIPGRGWISMTPSSAWTGRSRP